MDTPKRKPNLMTASRSGQDQGQRILASLEHGGKPVAPPRRAAARQLDSWIVGVCSLVVVLAAIAWTMRDGSVAPSRQRQETMAARPASAASAAPTASGEPTASAEAGVIPPAGGQAAAIVNEPAAPERRATQTHVATSDWTSATTTALPAAAPVLAAHKAPPAHANIKAAQNAQSQSVSAVPRTAGTASTAARASGTTTPAGAAADTDVALLTALVAHAGQPTAVTPERSRDVVERRDGDSTATLLARCKQLGLIEGMLCRSRICSGRWEADAACRAPSH